MKDNHSLVSRETERERERDNEREKEKEREREREREVYENRFFIDLAPSTYSV